MSSSDPSAIDPDPLAPDALPWLGAYPAGVPATIDPDAYASLWALVAAACEQYRERVAFTCMGRSLRYGEVARLSAAFAGFLTARGARKGDRVGLMMPNCLQYPIAMLGALRAGCVVVNVNPQYTPREVRHQLADAGVRILVVMDLSAHIVAEVAADVPVETYVVTSLGELLGWKGKVVDFVIRRVKGMVKPWRLAGAVGFRAALAHDPVPAAEVVGSDLAFLQYTGGTTGVAKGAMLTHRNLVANLLQVQAWCHSLRPATERVVTALPLYHVFALVANCLLFLHLGGENVLVPNGRDMTGLVKLLRRRRYTAMTGVNTLFSALLHTEGFDRVDFSGFKVWLGGGMAVHRSVAERWQAVTGQPLVEGYGLTEASPVVCVNRLDIGEYTGGIGFPVPSTEVAVLDERGARLGIDEPGELCVRGPQVMSGYWQRPTETAKVLVDGWLHTGDVACMDARGMFRIVDRMKDMIVVSGFKVFPSEIEEVVARLPGVREVGAIGVPDAEGNETVKLVIACSDPSLTAEAVIAHCRANLTRYKIPRVVEFRDSLPKSNVGKILRRELRDSAE